MNKHFHCISNQLSNTCQTIRKNVSLFNKKILILGLVSLACLNHCGQQPINHTIAHNDKNSAHNSIHSPIQNETHTTSEQAQQTQSNTVEAKNSHPHILALQKFESANPISDAKAAIDNNNFHFFASAPRGSIDLIGISDIQRQNIPNANYKIQEGMGDVILNIQHMRLRNRFIEYATQYNQALLKELNKE